MGSRPDGLTLIVWRISNYDDVSGRGGLAVSGRWHTRPRLIVYCADEPYTAYCEVLKQVGSEMFLPDDYKTLEIAGPARAKVEQLSSDRLGVDWFEDSSGALLACRNLGDEWLAACRTPLLKVPSAARIGSFNYLLNPVHRDADDFRVVRTVPLPFPDWVKSPS